jgi:hypothetical protein
MKKGTLLIEGFGLDENGKILAAEPGQRNWQGMRWLTIARVEVEVDVDCEGYVMLVTAFLDGEEITGRELMHVLNFREPGATGAQIDRALAEIYWDGKAVAHC